jgi:hypothetical protein
MVRTTTVLDDSRKIESNATLSAVASSIPFGFRPPHPSKKNPLFHWKRNPRYSHCIFFTAVKSVLFWVFLPSHSLVRPRYPRASLITREGGSVGKDSLIKRRIINPGPTSRVGAWCT